MKQYRLLAPSAVIVGLAIASSSSFAQAQRARAQDATAQRAPGQGAGNRAALERQMQQMLWRLTRQRVGLTDAQMKQLAPVNQRFEVRRRAIQRQERDTRLALRQSVVDSTAADQRRIGEHIDRLLQLERQRIDLLQEEQRELARFMSPVQRAKYMALQEQVRRRVEQRRRADLGTGSGGSARANTKRP